MAEFVQQLNQVIFNPLIALMFAVAIVVFTWGLFGFVANANDVERREQGKRHMLWGVIGLFVMVGVFGIIRILLNTFEVDLEPEREELLNLNDLPDR